LHWNWVCSVLAAQILKSRQRTDESMQTIYGVGVLIVILHVILIGVIVAKYGVVKPPI
jgi:predicted nucleic acid-binding Zn ribbon protein